MGFFDNYLSGLPVVGGFFDNTDEQALEQLKNNQRLYGDIALPDLEKYAPQEYSYSGDYSPEAIQAQTVTEDPAVRQRQMDVLAKMAGYADTGLSDVDALGYAKAQNMGAQLAKSGNAAAMQNAQARGVAGGGLGFANREMANQAGAQRAQEAAMQQAADSARQRALYTQAYGSALGNMRNQDYNVNAGNTDIINRFNQLNASNRNSAQLRNLDARQNTGNANVDLRNQAQLKNNDIRQQRFNNSITKAGGQAQANTGMAQGYAAENAARTADRNRNTDIMLKAMGMGV